MSENDINILINYSEIIGNWLCIKILDKISQCKQPVNIELVQQELSIGLTLPTYYYKEKFKLLEYHGLINKHNMITLKGRRFLRLLNTLVVLE